MEYFGVGDKIWGDLPVYGLELRCCVWVYDFGKGLL